MEAYEYMINGYTFCTDPNPLPMTDSPWPVTFILASYIIFVLKLGKIYMRNRDPYDLRRVLYVYNLGQVAYNGIYFAIVSREVHEVQSLLITV